MERINGLLLSHRPFHQGDAARHIAYAFFPQTSLNNGRTYLLHFRVLFGGTLLTRRAVPRNGRDDTTRVPGNFPAASHGAHDAGTVRKNRLFPGDSCLPGRCAPADCGRSSPDDPSSLRANARGPVVVYSRDGERIFGAVKIRIFPGHVDSDNIIYLLWRACRYFITLG